MGVMGHLLMGELELWALSAGRYKLDGGAMFGVVPKPIWERQIVPDEKGRIEMGMTCLLVRTPFENVLIETGFGGKVSEKQRIIFGLDESVGLFDSLSKVGMIPDEIDRVILTHLHQDHAGGCTLGKEDGYAVAFPNARYMIQRGEWEDAVNADGQTIAGYRLKEVLRPLKLAGVIDLLDGDVEICNGVRVFLTPGHTRAHQSVLVESEGTTVCFIGDLIPTRNHIPPVYVMAFDLFPRTTFRMKQVILKQAAQKGWCMVWPHDPDVAWSYVTVGSDGKFISID